MRVAVIIPSRGRHDGLAAVLRCLQALESTQHEIQYVVSYCEDEPHTRWVAEDAGALAIQRPADCTPGAAFNHACAYAKADVYTGFCDDVFPLTSGWDHYLALAIEQKDLACFCWEEVNDPYNISYIASSVRVQKAIGDLCPEYFPFWFNDLWLAEIHALAFGHFPKRIDGLKLCNNKRGKTRGMRDYPFWCDVFVATRGERVVAAGKLAAEYAVKPVTLSDAMPVFTQLDNDRIKSAGWLTERYEDKAEPEPYYTLAKERAFNLLREAA